MTKRYNYDLSNTSFIIGKVGHLAVLNAIPVIPGDSISIDAIGSFNLGAFAREYIMDSKVTIATVFVPHSLSNLNISHGSQTDEIKETDAKVYYNWIVSDEIMKGSGGTYTQPNLPMMTAKVDFLPWTHKSYSVPRWLVNSYLWIFNTYFRHPDFPIQGIDMASTSINDYANFGYPTVRLPNFHTSAIKTRYVPNPDAQ